VSRGEVSTVLGSLEDVLLIQTSWKRAALLLSWVVACAEADLGSQQSANSSSQADKALDAAAAADAQPPAADDAADKDAGTLRIVLLGDSITEGSCTSQLLWQNLREAGVESFDMVGTRKNTQECGVQDADGDNEGHSGYLATRMVDDGPNAAELVAWCNADRGDVVLMHLGTNDIWQQDIEPAKILDAFSKILTQLRTVQPNVSVFVAQIIPMRPDGCNGCAERVSKLNEEIPAWAKRESQPESRVYVVDQFSGFDATQDTGDGVHPNQAGAKKMADKWSAALLETLSL
jgi:lysophospholipase L1-like esterase